MMTDIELLILSVEKYPCIWNTQAEDYHNREIKDIAWDEICQVMYNNWETIENKQLKCTSLKKKWNNVRDYYRKELQKIKNSPTVSTKQKRYIYADMLSFLESVFTKRNNDGNYLDDSDVEGAKVGQEYTEILPLKIELQEHIQPQIEQNPQRYKKIKSDLPNEILNIFNKLEKPLEDDDAKFLSSFVSDMKKMEHKQKINFKLGMVQLLQKTFEGPSADSSP